MIPQGMSQSGTPCCPPCSNSALNTFGPQYLYPLSVSCSHVLGETARRVKTSCSQENSRVLVSINVGNKAVGTGGVGEGIGKL